MFGIGKSNADNAISLDEWLQFNGDTEKRRNLFISMSSSLKYIHNRGYYVSSFLPANIDVLDGTYSRVRFNELDTMPDDYKTKTDIVRQNIFDTAFLQIGIYTDCLPYLKRDFLVDNFDEFSTFLPSTDIPYYKGVVQRGANVYLVDFCNELRNRELSALGASLDGDNNQSSNISNMGQSSSKGNKMLSKSNGKSILSDDQYSSIYDLNKTKDAAFVSFLLIPLFVSAFGIIFTVLAWLLHIS